MTTTYRDLIKRAEQFLTNPADAEYFVQALSDKKRHELFGSQGAASQELLFELERYIDKYRPDMPIQHLINKAYFFSNALYVDERVMIPRPETEELVTKTAVWLNRLNIIPKTILDIGTGSGAIAIALACIFTRANIQATDISPDALAVCKTNIIKYKLVNRINIIQADLYPKTTVKFDLIISNPPYIPQDEINLLAPSVKNYEPHLALDGGRQGFEKIEKIIGQAPGYLTENGLLALEIDPRQERLIKNLMSSAVFEKDNNSFIRYAFIKYV